MDSSDSFHTKCDSLTYVCKWAMCRASTNCCVRLCNCYVLALRHDVVDLKHTGNNAMM
jgi:hypothetical protein